ncbi:nucleotidyltransferase domain-containing protein [Solwaraspora sp. WMMD406]|uniref:nucleotidyltransferase domain-containing protein n=1 Tax=Solwaraspora sp. WMMD406 TaxID=3016095 RepID=UPI002417973E|nr:nucleotidyltransferase domain-containing protein [Solwaraspora sp. WMMD406]MDG4765118.1 nucleotidyltransferase domain-containing protein [Solwaraspora sp. WMMD406]
MIEHALEDASHICAAVVGDAGYGLAYGSHAAGNAKPDSDLDLLYVAATELGHTQAVRLIEQVVALHRKHQLRLDHEVAYEVKLYATLAQVDAAIALRGLMIQPDGRLRVPQLVAQPLFLNSVPFKLRLIFNALTSAHAFLGGNLNLYQHHRAQACRSLALLALALLDPVSSFTATQVVAVLTHGYGTAGKDYLGYTGDATLYSALQQGLIHLAAEQAVTVVDGTHYRAHPQVCRQLVATLTGSTPAIAEPNDDAATMANTNH